MCGELEFQRGLLLLCALLKGACFFLSGKREFIALKLIWVDFSNLDYESLRLSLSHSRSIRLQDASRFRQHRRRIRPKSHRRLAAAAAKVWCHPAC